MPAPRRVVLRVTSPTDDAPDRPIEIRTFEPPADGAASTPRGPSPSVVECAPRRYLTVDEARDLAHCLTAAADATDVGEWYVASIV